MMKRKWFVPFMATALMVTVGSFGVHAQETAGTEMQPQEIVIETVDDLLTFASGVNDGSMFGYAGQTVLLDADLDLEGVDWEPIGNMNDFENFSTVFMGTFDGQGHTISNLTYENEGNITGAGLFGISFGMIQNLNMDNCAVTVKGLDAGDSQAIGIIVDDYRMLRQQQQHHRLELCGSSGRRQRRQCDRLHSNRLYRYHPW